MILTDSGVCWILCYDNFNLSPNEIKYSFATIDTQELKPILSTILVDVLSYRFRVGLKSIEAQTLFSFPIGILFSSLLFLYFYYLVKISFDKVS